MDADVEMNKNEHAVLAWLGRTLQQEGLTWGSSGNLSVRHGSDPEKMVITASGSRLGALEPTDVVTVGLADRRPEPREGRRPSKEHGMHSGIYRTRSKVRCVVHASPPYATFAACTGLELPTRAFPEGMMQLSSIRRVGYQHAGSLALAEAVEEAAEDSDILLLENHGVLIAAETSDDALLWLQTLEFASRLAFMGRSSGIEIRELDAQTVTQFRASGYRR